MKRSGFTLLELILVIAIIGVLAGAMVPLFTTTREEARQAKAAAEMDAVKTAAMMLFGDTGSWPPANNTGECLTTNCTSTMTGWRGPYMDEWKNDPWASTSDPNRPYEIINNTSGIYVHSDGSTQSGTLDSIIRSNP